MSTPDTESNAFVRRWDGFFSKPGPNLALRIATMFLGLICIALGISLAKLAMMGTAPISSIPAVLTEICERFGVPVTMGMWTFASNLCFFLLEVALLRSKFKAIQLLQIPLFFVLSVFVDIWLGVFGQFAPHSYQLQLAWLLVSILTLGFGIRVQLGSDLLMSPGDAAVQVLAYVTKRRFSKCKVAWDVSLMSLSALTSLFVLGGLYQVREGTIISALLVGPAVRLWDCVLRRVSWVIPPATRRLVPPLCPELPGAEGDDAEFVDEDDAGDELRQAR